MLASTTGVVTRDSQRRAGLLVPRRLGGRGVRTLAPADRFPRRFPCPRRPECHPYKEEGEGGGARGEGDTKARQQKARREMQHPIYF